MGLAFFRHCNSIDEFSLFRFIHGSVFEGFDGISKIHPSLVLIGLEVGHRDARRGVVAKSRLIGVITEGTRNIIGLEDVQIGVGRIGVSLFAFDGWAV